MAEEPPISRPPGFWEAVKVDYFGGVKLVDIYARHSLTKGELDSHRRRADWATRHKAPVNRERLVGRIFWLINKHIAAMEHQVNEGNYADVKVLNQLVSSLGRLMRFETGSSTPATSKWPRRGRTAELQDIREKLVRRIEELKRN